MQIVFSDIPNKVDIVLLQQHWLFLCELSFLTEIHTNFRGIGNTVDGEDPLPKGYGGVCII